MHKTKYKRITNDEREDVNRFLALDSVQNAGGGVIFYDFSTYSIPFITLRAGKRMASLTGLY